MQHATTLLLVFFFNVSPHIVTVYCFFETETLCISKRHFLLAPSSLFLFHFSPLLQVLHIRLLFDWTSKVLRKKERNWPNGFHLRSIIHRLSHQNFCSYLASMKKGDLVSVSSLSLSLSPVDVLSLKVMK